MFDTSTVTDTESAIRKFWESETTLGVRRQVLLDAAEREQLESGERFLDNEEVMRHAADSVTRANSEAAILAGSITAARKRRLAAIERRIQLQRDAARAPIATKDKELAALLKKRERLLKQLTKLEAADMTAAQASADTPKSVKLTQEIEALQRTAADLESTKPGLTGVIESSSVEDLLVRAGERVLSELVPSEFSIRAWATAVEGQVSADRPRLLVEHKVIQSHLVEGHGWANNTGIVNDGFKMEAYKRLYSLAFQNGEINQVGSTLTFLGTRDDGGGPPVFTVNGCTSHGEPGVQRGGWMRAQ